MAGSIPNEVISFFSTPNPSSRTMALGSTQPQTEMSERIVYKMWEPRRLTPLWASTACYKDSFALSRALIRINSF
jgi:hypothetical protein